MPRPRSPRSTAWTASSWGRPISRHPWVCSVGRRTPTWSPPSLRAFDAVRAAGKPVGVNAFDPAVADRYLAAGASFVLVGADVALLARGSEALAARFIAADGPERASY